VTARAAGVEEVVVCTPPPIDPALLGACELCGIDEVYAMGGAQAVAALAHGTQSIPAIDVIVARATSTSRRPSASSPIASASTVSPVPAICSCCSTPAMSAACA
jgi:histidinol dehydrogenase